MREIRSQLRRARPRTEDDERREEGVGPHLIGGVLCSVLLGPSAAILVIASVLIVFSVYTYQRERNAGSVEFDNLNGGGPPSECP